MNKDHIDKIRFRLIINGLPKDDGKIKFSDFLGRLQNWISALRKIDREVSNGINANNFIITALSYTSPALVEVEPYQQDKELDTRIALSERFEHYIKNIQQETIPPDINYDVLEDIQQIVKPVGKTIESVSLGTNGNDYELSKKTLKFIEYNLAGIDQCVGTIEGDLDQINIHRGINIFYIYPIIGPHKVKCHFPTNLTEDAKAAIGCQVSVSGTLKYRSKADFPHEIDVNEMEIFPKEDELPTLEDFRGLAPAITGKLSSEEFIRRQRDAWD